MATLCPYTFLQYLDNNGDPLSGGLVYTYDAGTTTPKATYTDDTEDTANPNPVVLDANGRADIWLGSGNYKLELRTSANVLIKTVDNVAGQSTGGIVSYNITTNTSITELYDRARIYVSGSVTLSLLPVADAGDGFEFRVYNIGSSNVTIDPDASETINDAATLTIPPGRWAQISCDGDEWYATGNQEFLIDKGTDVASASSVALFDAASDFVEITGTTTITAFTGDKYSQSWVRFAGILTLTHNGTSLILPTGANITTAAGDIAHFAKDSSGNVTCLDYARADGTALTAPASIEKASQAEVEAESSVDKYVPPDLLKYNPGTAKVSIVMDGTGTPSVTSGFGVSSITDNGAGDYTLNFSTAFSSANYVVQISVEPSAANSTNYNGVVKRGTRATGSVGIQVGTVTSVLEDLDNIYVTIWGDQ